MNRCFWVPAGDALYASYHDHEWGFPVADDVRLFEKLCLEGFQSGLSWRTILGKRDNFRRAFADFDLHRVARCGEKDVARLLGNAGIVRHRGKIEATINNAARALEVVEEFGSLAAYVWRFEPEPSSRPDRITEEVLHTMATTPESVALSKDLRKRGWRFVGPTTVYAFMQAMGMVNDHEDGCTVRADADAARGSFVVPKQGT
ncbi:MAG: DNA-3-methyladenine glycosylase I [Gemmatimonadota bacterium]|nr:DNA-3-methyladenine glycosylase I [Gemmatimonadota bacterium]